MIFSSLRCITHHLFQFVLCRNFLSLAMVMVMSLFTKPVFAQNTFTFEFTGGIQTFVVPAGVTLLHVDAFGAEGGQGDALGGLGGRVETTITVTPGETLYLFVGGVGGDSGGSGQPGPGGFNGGGDGGCAQSFFSPTGFFCGGGGGGASDIRQGGTTLTDRIVVAGGGGGGGIGSPTGPGGAGGGTEAESGGDSTGGLGGGGGTQTAGGAGGVSITGGTAGTDGDFGTGGQGGVGSPNGRGGGGGGGGYFGGGGGGGGSSLDGAGGGGGGGGSSFSLGTNTIHTPDFQIGNGLIILMVPSELDSDNDGIPDADDACPDTILPERVPTVRLGVNRFANTDTDIDFETTPPNGQGPQKSFTMEDTAGCSCEQIIEALGLGKGHEKFGCSISAMEEWVALVNQ
jgi:hypothetical protein